MDVGGYVIYEWTNLHNHDLIDADKVHLLPLFRRIQPSQKALIDLHISSGISQRAMYDTLLRTYGGHSNIGFTHKDLTNYVNVVKRREMAPGDATMMQKCFGTNKQYRPLGIFVGFNYQGTCVFGGALLYEETTTTFKWLFDTFMRCINYKLPQTMMTDQASAIVAALREVLPGVYLDFCAWHIDQNARKKLGARATFMFFEEFNHLIRHVHTEAEFEYGWQRMLVSCFDNKPTSDFKWLQFIYGFRTQWSSAWVKSNFTAAKSTTQLSEQFNAFARYYLKPDYSITEMLRRFQSLVDDLRHNEKAKDFYMQNTSPDNRFKNSLLMCHAALVFTPSVC
ncbi:hypothetical protein LIER_03354 [Lithospermum erythrorhizon]|uniref:MULE transposase domain-containing protein n=1 Tax=Lithospermum erythrorhizon TaxID=34254 RepID=A0AAV3NSS6_LITER